MELTFRPKSPLQQSQTNTTFGFNDGEKAAAKSLLALALGSVPEPSCTTAASSPNHPETGTRFHTVSGAEPSAYIPSKFEGENSEGTIMGDPEDFKAADTSDWTDDQGMSILLEAVEVEAVKETEEFMAAQERMTSWEIDSAV